MGAKIFLGLLIGLISSYAFDKVKERRNQTPPPTRWWLLGLSVIPGFFVGAIMAGILESMNLIEDAEAFSPAFYIFISIGSILSYWVLNRIIPVKSD